MKVTNGNGEVANAKLGRSEWVKIIAAAAASVAALIVLLTFMGLSPAGVREVESRMTRIETHLEAATKATALTAIKLDEHLEQTRTGYERLSALEQHARDTDRRFAER